MKYLFYTLILAFLHCGQAGKPHPIQKHFPAKTIAKPVPTIGLLFFDNVEADRQQYLAGEVSRFYNIRVTVVKPIPLPRSAFYPPRLRYRADSLIAFLGRTKPQNLDRIIGVTSKDISCTNDDIPDWGIFGL